MTSRLGPLPFSGLWLLREVDVETPGSSFCSCDFSSAPQIPPGPPGRVGEHFARLSAACQGKR